LAFTKEQKQQMLAEYEEWLSKSQAVFLMEYTKMSVKRVEELRARVREVGGEAHIVKNTLFKLALEKAGYQLKDDLTLTTLAGFAFEDSPALAKTFAEAAKDAEMFNFKMGYLNKAQISANDIKALADLPPLPVLRAQLLGVLQAPAGKLVRTIAEPARGLASVFRAYSEKSGEAAAA
jgi:large subunit ribosomal protein L10